MIKKCPLCGCNYEDGQKECYPYNNILIFEGIEYDLDKNNGVSINLKEHKMKLFYKKAMKYFQGCDEKTWRMKTYPITTPQRISTET